MLRKLEPVYRRSVDTEKSKRCISPRLKRCSCSQPVRKICKNHITVMTSADQEEWYLERKKQRNSQQDLQYSRNRAKNANLESSKEQIRERVRTIKFSDKQ